MVISCNLCKKSFKWKYSYILHLRLEHAIFKCYICGLNYDLYSSLLRHRYQDHTDEEKRQAHISENKDKEYEKDDEKRKDINQKIKNCGKLLLNISDELSLTRDLINKTPIWKKEHCEKNIGC